MNELSAKERGLLLRISEKADLQPLFFKKAKGIRWFDALSERGYFRPENNPRPEEPADEEGYVRILNWPVAKYLVNTAPELQSLENTEYARKFLNILISTTEYARENDFHNCGTWWHFSKIIRNIPPEVTSVQDLDIVDYWFDDQFKHGPLAKEVGIKWLPSLLKKEGSHERELATRLLEIIYKVKYKDDQFSGRKAVLRVDSYHAKEITEEVATLAGQTVGADVLAIFDRLLRFIFDKSKNDSWSYIWHPAIEPHSQNKYADDAKNILIDAYRDALAGHIKREHEEGFHYVSKMMKSAYEPIKRLAIHTIGENFRICRELIDSLLVDSQYFSDHYRHEMWRLLNLGYDKFTEKQKKKVLKIILDITRSDAEENVHPAETAYIQACWLSAIKGAGIEEKDLYFEKAKTAGTEPDHPWSSGSVVIEWVAPESPISLDRLQGMEVDQLIETLKDNLAKSLRLAERGGTQGLFAALRELIKASPLKFYSQLSSFEALDLAYVNQVIEAYRELWTEKAKLPWDDMWAPLLAFCKNVTQRDEFWSEESAERRGVFAADRSWVISSIARLIEEGTKSDDHAFDKKHLPVAEEIIVFLLNRNTGREFSTENSAVSSAINSPRGHSLQALINITLRRCRLADFVSDGSHSDVWDHFQPYYEKELDKIDIPEYEFVTLVTSYLANFLYMSEDWTLANLGRIFDRSNDAWWRCAMEGYVHGGGVFEEIYSYLKVNGHLGQALDDELLNNHTDRRIIEYIGVAYLHEFEELADKNSLIRVLISRGKPTELSYLIRFIWGMGRGENGIIKAKVFELWPKILECADISTLEGKKLASQLCLWTMFVDNIDDMRRDWLLAVAPFAHVESNTHEMLESLATISRTQPFEAHNIWMKLLEGSTPDYPEDAIREILTNLVRSGANGLLKANEAASIYIKVANEKPRIWLREIEKTNLEKKPFD